jgi:hypothetical protein
MSDSESTSAGASTSQNASTQPTIDLASAGLDYDAETDTFFSTGAYVSSPGSQVGSDHEDEEDDEDEDSGMPEGEDEEGNDPDVTSFKKT